MTTPDRTREAALKVLEEVRQGIADKLGDHSHLLTDKLLSDVFDQAWLGQFDEDRRHTRRRVREIVSDAIALDEVEN